MCFLGGSGGGCFLGECFLGGLKARAWEKSFLVCSVLECVCTVCNIRSTVKADLQYDISVRYVTLRYVRTYVIIVNAY